MRAAYTNPWSSSARLQDVKDCEAIERVMAATFDDGLAGLFEDEHDLIIEAASLDGTIAVGKHDGLAVFSQLVCQLRYGIRAKVDPVGLWQVKSPSLMSPFGQVAMLGNVRPVLRGIRPLYYLLC